MNPLLFNAPTDLASWLGFGAVHGLDHHQMAAQAFEVTGQEVPVLPIDPVPLASTGTMLAWFQDHSTMHAALHAVLGTQGFDLSMVDFTNEQERGIWMEYNAQEHEIIAERISQLRTRPAPQPQAQPVMPQPLLTLQAQEGGVQPQPILPVTPQPAPAQAQPSPAIQPQPAPVPQLSSPGSPTTPGTPGGD